MPIVLSKEEWERIKLWADEDREDPDTVRRRDYLKYLNDTSREMTKTWPNSLENVNKRNDELRRARREAAEQTNTKFYKRYCKRKIEEQERLMHSARDTIFKNKDAPKMLLGAVIESAIQHERGLQLKFKKEVLDKYVEEQKRLSDQEITERAKAWTELQNLKAARKREINKKHQQELVAQAKELREREQNEKEEELRLERLDIEKANEELEQLREFEAAYKEAEKQRIWRDNAQSLQEYHERKAEQAARDKMDDDLLNVLLRSTASIEKKRKETEKELRAARQRVLQAISSKLESGTAARDEKEAESLAAAVKERIEAENARHQAYLDKEARNNKAKLEAREQFLKDEEQRLHEMDTMKRWEMMNRFKNAELYDEYKENSRKEKERKVKEYHDDLVRMRKESDDREAQERAELRYFYGELAEKKLRDADNKLLTHAAALLEEAKEKGRPQLPLLKAIDRYCKLYRLYPMPDLPKPLQKIFPQYKPSDGSKPDPWYKEPPPPPPDRGPDYYEDDVDGATAGRNDGLQEIVMPGPSKAPEKKPESNQDYKRASRANGLQQKPESPTLPPIQVIPCTTADCSCDLKPKLQAEGRCVK